MVYPMMVGVDFGAASRVARQPKGRLVALSVNWLIKPFTIAGLAVLFSEVVIWPFISPEAAASYIAGLILMRAAHYTAMVFVWSQIAVVELPLLQVSVSDLIMIVAFARAPSALIGH